jgi:hypothetical protein
VPGLAVGYFALVEKGYNPIRQIAGYLTSGDPAYITDHLDARNTTGEIPIQRLQEEGLKPLPPTERWEKFRYEVRRVSLDGFVSYDGALYGVNWRYSGREILVRELAGQVEIWAAFLLRSKIGFEAIKNS